MIEIEPYRALWKREEQDNKELREIIEYKEQKIERQKEIIKQLDIKNLELTTIIKEVRNQLSYLETYSSKEDVFEDMKRRLDRIDKIIGSDKE